MTLNLKRTNTDLKFMSLLVFLMFFSNLFGQQKIISGVVSDSYGNPIPGVNILQETQKNNGTITDFDGKFTISINDESMLILVM
jgi:hypothetical protein